jgi:TRAP-type C4-dicarboxylate transport system substrate-binding protein
MIFVVTNAVWKKIPEKHRKAMEVLFPKSEVDLESLALTGNKKSYKAMIKYGIKEVKLTPQELDRFKKATRTVWDELAGKSYSRNFLYEVIGHLDDYRKNKKNIIQD